MSIFAKQKTNRLNEDSARAMLVCEKIHNEISVKKTAAQKERVIKSFSVGKSNLCNWKIEKSCRRK